MDSGKLAWSIVMTALALWGCNGLPPGETFPERDKVCAAGESPPCETTENAHTDAERTHEPGEELDGETRTYVVSVLNVPDGLDGTSPGFNLDGIDSGEGTEGTTCEERNPDFVSPADPDHAGVDNGLIGLLELVGDVVGDFDVNGALAEQISSGSLLLLVEVTGIDSFSYDTEISMQLALGALPEGATLQLEDGYIAAGQTFDVAMDVGPTVSGDIYNGRLRATASDLIVPVDTEEFSLDLQISSPEVRFDISEDGLANGVIGGTLTMDDLIEAARAIPEAAMLCGDDPECATVRMLIGTRADIGPSAEDETVCESFSVGIGFEATTATTN